MSKQGTIVERLRADRLMNPDYPTRLEAAALLEEVERVIGMYQRATGNTTYPETHPIWEASHHARALLSKLQEGK